MVLASAVIPAAPRSQPTVAPAPAAANPTCSCALSTPELRGASAMAKVLNPDISVTGTRHGTQHRESAARVATAESELGLQATLIPTPRPILSLLQRTGRGRRGLPDLHLAARGIRRQGRQPLRLGKINTMHDHVLT
jgi:hypothetical protein